MEVKYGNNNINNIDSNYGWTEWRPFPNSKKDFYMHPLEQESIN